MDTTAILEFLAAKVPGVEPLISQDGMPTIGVPREQLVETCRILRDTPELRFAVLVDVVPYDFHPREPRFDISYLLLSPGVAGFGATPARLRVKIQVPGTDPRVPTVSGVWTAANWAEREVFDLFGIQIDGHADLRRVLMPEDWEGFPLRKDYPVQIKDAVKTYEPLQLSPEEFAANIENARGTSKA